MDEGTIALERTDKELEILKVLAKEKSPISSKKIADELLRRGYKLHESTVRYHLHTLETLGLTMNKGVRGTIITQKGMEELNSNLAGERVGYIIDTLDRLTVGVTFNPKDGKGKVEVNVAFVKKEDLDRCLTIIKETPRELVPSLKVKIADEGEILGDTLVPEGKACIANLACTTVDAMLIKEGIPTTSRCNGLLEIRDRKPVRFTEIITFEGTSIDPARMYIKSGMTSARRVATTGSGMISAVLSEIPSAALDKASEIINNLRLFDISATLKIGDIGRPVFGLGVSNSQRVGIVNVAGMNQFAMFYESGIEVDMSSIATLLDFQDFREI
nr:NrpR regulatory domain-containing protein [Candidatus Freyarchaeota archaeon]